MGGVEIKRDGIKLLLEGKMAALDDLIETLHTLPESRYDLRPPCPSERVRHEEERLGQFPPEIVSTLRRFNGGSLFIDAIEFVTLFGLSSPEDDPVSDWFIDRFTPPWRSRMGRPHDLVIGMFNYGGIVTFGEDLIVREWDSVQAKWSSEHEPMPYGTWLGMILAEGSDYLAEF